MTRELGMTVLEPGEVVECGELMRNLIQDFMTVLTQCTKCDVVSATVWSILESIRRLEDVVCMGTVSAAILCHIMRVV